MNAENAASVAGDVGKRKKSGTVFGVLAALLLVAAVVVAVWLLGMHQRAVVNSPDGTGSSVDYETDDDGFPVIDWDYWLSVNPDIVGWVTVEGTSIDYPIVQASSEDPDFYLHHDITGSYSVYGAIYLAAECAETGGLLGSPNAIVYGHHMNDGSMFADFADFSTQSYLDKHETILVQTPQGEKVKYLARYANIVNAATTQAQITFADETEHEKWYLDGLGSATACGQASAVPETAITWCTCSYLRFVNERTLVVSSPKAG